MIAKEHIKAIITKEHRKAIITMWGRKYSPKIAKYFKENNILNAKGKAYTSASIQKTILGVECDVKIATEIANFFLLTKKQKEHTQQLLDETFK